mmetsp:Transcript_13595/g.31871  ORF Transcript_13595/g.31871 Transcript_13595/m.31871 type:complete len:282 (+) Transcript_13595:94-939(+)
MSPSLNKITALALYGIVFASFLQSVCLGEVVEDHEPRKRHLRSVHDAPRTSDTIHIPDIRRRVEARDPQPEIGAEAPIVEQQPEEEIVRHSPTEDDAEATGGIELEPDEEIVRHSPAEDDTEATGGIELEPDEDIVRHDPVTEAPRDRDQAPEVGAEAPTEAPERDQEPEVGAEAPTEAPEAPDRDQEVVGSEIPVDNEPTSPPVGEEGTSNPGTDCVDDPDFIYRSKDDKDCEWLALKSETTARKICLKRAFKEQEDETKVYSYCKATCDSVNIKHACDL